ncbi:MAG: hypothetical protein KDB46_14130, partial [Solirubrobacterales bacterium]|nr:hypothetical protein [Solirubrobacterales bacterium]
EAAVATESLEFDGKRVDLRTRTGRRWRDIVRNLADQLGGSLTPSQALLVRRAATFAILLERDEAVLLSGGKIDESGYRANSDRLKANMVQLGLSKLSRDVTKADQEPADDHAAMILGM